VTTDFTAAPSPMSSTGSPTRTWPRSIAPVTTVPRPVMVMEFSTAIRNGAPTYRVCGITPSSAETTRTAPSTCAAPVIMFLM